ncbi:DciA family protein [Streptomyces sp. NPDC017082]|uniref:DciA family protein n=1 Tax=Streptomyces sp. NPDC017082 TaxID=3364974 RepID=UPI003796966A
MADRAWELPAAGGSVLDQWPDIAAAVAPQLPHHVAAVAFHPETGQLDLRPDSSAYATQLRLITARIVATANEAAGTEAVRTVRVLPPGGRSRASDRAGGPGRRAGHSASAGEDARDGIARLPPGARRPPRSPASPARRPGCPGGNRVTDPRPARAQPARLPRPGR